VGAYGTQAAADGVVKRLSAAGIRASVERIETASGVRYRVRTNPVQGRAAADQLRARIKEKGLDSTVVPL
jgi:cell division protein FtsN